MEKISSVNNIDLKTLTTPEQLIDLASHGRLKLAQLQTLIAIRPGIVTATVEAIHASVKVAETAGKKSDLSH